MSRRLFGSICLLSVVAAGAITTALYRRDISAARARVSTGSVMADTPCGQIEYADEGNGQAVLVIHGAGGGFDQGLGLGRELADRGFRVVAMSRFGYLRTPLPFDASAAAQADSHACLLDALKIQSAIIIGASAGAPSAMQLAIRHPGRVAALVLLVPAAYAPRADSSSSLVTPHGTSFLFSTALRSDLVFWTIRRAAPGLMIRSILATPLENLDGASDAERQRVEAVLDGILPVSQRRRGLLTDAVVTSAPSRYELEKIKAPTLSISVADDLFGTYAVARYLADHISGSRFIGYRTGGHIWLGHQGDLKRDITAFINGSLSPQ